MIPTEIVESGNAAAANGEAPAPAGSNWSGSPAAAGESTRTSVAHHEWVFSLALALLDMVAWGMITVTLTSVRQDIYLAGRFGFVVVALLQFAIITVALYVIGGYNPRTEMRSLGYTTEHLLGLGCALLVSLVVIYTAATFDDSMKPSRSVVLASFVLFTPVSLVYRRRLRGRASAVAGNRAFLVLGSGAVAADFYHAYRASPNNQRLEFVDAQGINVGQEIAGPGSPTVTGNLREKLGEISQRYSGVILAERVDRMRPELLDQLIRTQFHQTRVYTIESFYEAHWQQVPTQSLDPFWPLQGGFQLSRNSPYHYVKRMFDVVAAVCGLIVLSPLIALIALLVLVTSGRPIIFRQRRLGRDEHVFTVYKFRTMRPAQEDVAGGIYTRADDPRVTPLGRWLRKLRLDELPQLWNVVRGELSLIGPRAEWEECAVRYQKKIPFYHFRHLVKPGITGWAQVNYPYGESDDDAIEKLKYDLYYIRRYSLKLDAMIVLKTIFTMFSARGR